jgi:hypothetical protein
MRVSTRQAVELIPSFGAQISSSRNKPLFDAVSGRHGCWVATVAGALFELRGVLFIVFPAPEKRANRRQIFIVLKSDLFSCVGL